MQAGANRWQLVHEQETAAAADIVGLTDDVTAIDFNLGLDVYRETTGIAFNVMDVVAVDEGQQLHACGVFTGQKGQAQSGRCGSSSTGPLPLDLGTNAKPHFFGEKMNVEFDLVTRGDVGFARDKEPAQVLLERLLPERCAVAQRQEQQWAGRGQWQSGRSDVDFDHSSPNAAPWPAWPGQGPAGVSGPSGGQLLDVQAQARPLEAPLVEFGDHGADEGLAARDRHVGVEAVGALTQHGGG